MNLPKQIKLLNSDFNKFTSKLEFSEFSDFLILIRENGYLVYAQNITKTSWKKTDNPKWSWENDNLINYKIINKKDEIIADNFLMGKILKVKVYDDLKKLINIFEIDEFFNNYNEEHEYSHEDLNSLKKIKGKVTFSKFCASGFYGENHCKCKRCCEKLNKPYDKTEEHKNWVYSRVMKGESFIVDDVQIIDFESEPIDFNKRVSMFYNGKLNKD